MSRRCVAAHPTARVAVNAIHGNKLTKIVHNQE